MSEESDLKPSTPPLTEPLNPAKTPRHWTRMVDSLMPERLCQYCHGLSQNGSLCQACLQVLTDRQTRCYQCALPLLSQSHDDHRSCGECLSKPPAFERSVTAGSYQPPINHWLNNFKLRRNLRDGHLLYQLLLAQIERLYRGQALPKLLIPVPLHCSRLFLRSFNQSAWLARQLQKSLRIDTLNGISRSSSGRAQKRLNRRQRQHNLNGVFHIKPLALSILRGQHVALIDDVVTTSATARVISQQLIDAGATRVDIWCLARTDKTGFQH